MFKKVLVANRGEIACRILRSLKRLGVGGVAVYSEADADAPHVEMADEAHLIGPPPAAKSYLKGRAIIEAAKRCGAEAIHPGYGFLSENAAFADACVRAGLVFIGPPAKAIRAFALKSAARARMVKAGVPVVPGYVPGYEEEDSSDQAFRAAAKRIGYPLLIKASAGGGGRGMRRVERPRDLKAALQSARREAKAAFGDDRLLLEKLLIGARHVEIQILVDAAGNAIHLFERDCSVQRRYQKIIEEAPAPGVSEALRQRMGEAALKAVRSVGYVGAGTVEFLLDRDGAFYFMEVNTRLQVEHPVTELITGLDLVNLQLRIAANEPFPIAQEDLRIDGHAIEARLYAENPARGFLPAGGRLLRFRPPADGYHLRIDSGVREGDEVGTFYDPMIAKLIVWDRTRPAAIRRLRACLRETVVIGVPTNLAFLLAITERDEFVEGGVDTAFVERHLDEIVGAPAPVPERVLALAALHILLALEEESRAAAAASDDPYSPWGRIDGWRANAGGGGELVFLHGSDELRVCWRADGGGYRLGLPSGEIAVRGGGGGGGDMLVAEMAGEKVAATVVRHGDEMTIHEGGVIYHLRIGGLLALVGGKEGDPGGLASPMPGRIIEVRVSPGSRVKRGDPLLVLEAMKMEHMLRAPAPGTVREVRFAVDDFVEEGVELIVLDMEEEE